MARQVGLANKMMEATVAAARDISEAIAKSGADAAGVVRQRVRAEGAAWISDPARSDKLVDLIMSRLPRTLAAIDKSELPSFLGEQVRTQLEEVEILPLSAGLFSALVKKGHHQQMFDGLLDWIEKMVNDASATEAVRDRIFAKLPSLLNLYRGQPMVMNKMIDATKALIVEIRADDAHPLRIELDRYLSALIERLRSSSEFASRLEAFRLDLLERPELGDLATRAWNALRDTVASDLDSEDSRIRQRLGAILAGIRG